MHRWPDPKAVEESLYSWTKRKDPPPTVKCFTAYYTRALLILYGFSISFWAFWTWTFHRAGEETLYTICALLITVLLGIVVYYLAYRCYIDEDGLTVVYFGLFRRKVAWKDVASYYVKRVHPRLSIFEHENYVQKVRLQDKRGKIVFRCTYALVGADMILRTVKRKNITRIK